MPAIEFRNVSKSFGDRQILKSISLTIDEGSIAVILGPSGTGKSVLIRCLIGLLKPDPGGQILVFGTDVAAIDERRRADRLKLYAVRKRFGMLFQDGALFDDMTVGENVAFPMRHHGGRMRESEIKARVADKLARVGLKDAVEKMPSELSGGMRKRAAFARAIAMEPDFVLCDEPSSGLDPVMAATLDELILEMHRELNIGFIVITHDTAEARLLGGRMGLLNKGELVVPFDATDKVLRSNHPAIRQFFDRQKDGPIQVV
ncbi:MAG: ATP-binding cassette domain-containing protein [Myxococcales bacterium]|nr:ATP-binding cassette domain-containing protein [Myxococcales bacterium]MCB9753878.1 ATP-binding cassette domain-containing protein [Myxococcales bacterium]